MRLMDTTTMSLRAKTARVVSGAAMMIASGVIAGMFHLTPAMAQADVLPQATQNPPEVAQAAVPEPKPSSPATATPGAAKPATPKKRSNVHRNGGDGDRREPTEQTFIDKDAQQRINDLARQMAEQTAKFNTPEFKQRMEDAQQQMAEATAKFNSPEFKQQMDDFARQMADETAKFNSPEFKKRMDDLQKQMQQQMEEFSRKYQRSPNP